MNQNPHVQEYSLQIESPGSKNQTEGQNTQQSKDLSFLDQPPAASQNFVINPHMNPTDANSAPFSQGLGADFNERKGFIVKVYAILSLQLFLTFVITLITYLNKGFRDFLVNPERGTLTAFSWVCVVVMFITQIAIVCFKQFARKVPNNYIALGLFTFCMSILVGGVCGVTYNRYENGGLIVLSASIMTLAVVLSLTVYASTTKSDFTMMGGALWIISIVLLVLSIIACFNKSIILQLILCGLTIILFGFYLIYDTQLIVGGKSHQFSIDDYIIAALCLYVDIIQLFLSILQILQGRK